MPLIMEDLGTLTIASGQVTSPALSTLWSAGQLKTALNFTDALSIYAPQGLAEDVMVEVSPVENPAATDWISKGLIDTGTSEDLLTEDDLNILDENGDYLLAESLAHGGIAVIEDLSFKDLRLVSSAPTGGARNFRLLSKLFIPD